MSGLTAAGLVVAAGMSSRMGQFKPLLPLDGQPLLYRTVESLLQGGVQQVVVVTGRNHEKIARLFANQQNVTLLHNVDYAVTAMLDSIQLGLTQLPPVDGLLFLPGDVPAIRPETIGLLLHTWQQSRPSVLYPVYPDEQGQLQQWHPPVISGSLIPALLQYDGPQGLQGALSAFAEDAQWLLVPDEGCILDADYPEDYQKLCQYWHRRYYPDLRQCQIFYQLAATPEPVQHHCLAVAEKALQLGVQLQERGMDLQLDLLESAALLHDVCRTETNHAAAGAAFLRRYGLDAVARLVMRHMDWPETEELVLDESAILYLADKLVSGNQKVSLDQRFAEKEQQYSQQLQALAQIQRRKQTALYIAQCIEAYGVTCIS